MDSHTLNRWLDRLPRASIALGTRVLPSYLTLGLVGAGVGFVHVLLLAALLGRSLLLTAVLMPIAASAIVLGGLLQRAIYRREHHALQLDFYLMLGLVAGTLRLVRLPLLPLLDLCAIAGATFLVFGRIGCTLGGCCYGRVAAIGIDYPPECGVPEPGMRRFPVQLVEASLWAWLSVGGSLITALAEPGTATLAIVIAYGAARCLLELLRADAQPRWLGATEGVWLSLLGIVCALALSASGQRAPSEAVIAGAGAGAGMRPGRSRVRASASARARAPPPRARLHPR